MSEAGTRAYELGYIMVPTMPETEVPANVEKLKEVVTNLGGVINSSGDPEFIDLAYVMEKNVASKKMKWSQGYFGWMKFEAAPEALEALKKALDGNTDLIRYILIKTHLENSVVFKKPKVEAKRDSLVEEVVDEEIEEDVQEDHEKLPDLEGEIAPEGVEQEEA